MAAERQKQTRRVITSFMLRFVHEAEVGENELEEPDETETDWITPEVGRSASWRGVVKHIQSGAEHHFTSLAEAESFIKKYIEQ